MSITSREGLLWRDGKVIDLPEADRVSIALGVPCAEALVRALCSTFKLDTGQFARPDSCCWCHVTRAEHSKGGAIFEERCDV